MVETLGRIYLEQGDGFVSGFVSIGRKSHLYIAVKDEDKQHPDEKLELYYELRLASPARMESIGEKAQRVARTLVMRRRNPSLG